MEYNSEKMKPLLSNDGYINFLIEFDNDTEYKFDFKIYSVDSWECDEESTPLDIEPYIRGVIKWDGCSHVWLGDEDGYLHLCGKGTWQLHVDVMNAVYKLAEETIIKYDREVAR